MRLKTQTVAHLIPEGAKTMPTYFNSSPRAVPAQASAVATETLLAAMHADAVSMLLHDAENAAERLRYTLQAYKGLEWLLSFSPEQSAPPPEQLGALVDAVNQASLICMGNLDSALAELRTALPAADKAPAAAA